MINTAKAYRNHIKCRSNQPKADSIHSIEEKPKYQRSVTRKWHRTASHGFVWLFPQMISE